VSDYNSIGIAELSFSGMRNWIRRQEEEKAENVESEKPKVNKQLSFIFFF